MYSIHPRSPFKTMVVGLMFCWELQKGGLQVKSCCMPANAPLSRSVRGVPAELLSRTLIGKVTCENNPKWADYLAPVKNLDETDSIDSCAARE
jgi:hypothetical protein